MGRFSSVFILCWFMNVIFQENGTVWHVFQL